MELFFTQVFTFYFYSIQDDRFRAAKLPRDYKFEFNENFEELNFRAKDGGEVSSILFKADSSHGVICFWKGNGGNLQKWGQLAAKFLKYNYDLLITDYREHGKSKGDISFENFHSDAQLVYDFLKTKYSEEKILVMGYSLGTNIASRLAAANSPSMTVLIDPKYKFEDKYLRMIFPFPDITRFPFRTDLDISAINAPVIIITGTKSDLYTDANKLEKLLDRNDKFFEIKDATHQTILADKEIDSIFRFLLLKTALK
ncbi:MAG TPA: alpha/beta fold hydrolase [Chryseosolibacter sp.]|nr:alpha/beta fold hydrolase [Chryseosolibacter sp.]